MGVVDYVDGYLFDEPLVLLGEDGAKWGIGELCAFKASGKYWVNNHAHIMRPDRAVVLDDWLVYFLCGADLLPFVTGLTVPKLNQERMRAIPVPIPPLDEQRRIVGVLDKAFAAIATATANAEKNLANTSSAFDGWLARTIEVDEGGGWKRHRLEELTTKIGSGATPRGGKQSYLSEGTPLIRSLNVHDRRFKPQQLAYIDNVQARQLANVTLQQGDVLLNITGASVARCCVLPDHLALGRVNQHVSIIRVKRDALTPKFLELLLTSATYKKRLLGVGEQGGSTRQALTKSELQTFEIIAPSIEKQQNIIDQAGALEALILELSQNYSQMVRLLDALKQSLLRCAFSGELAAIGPETITA